MEFDFVVVPGERIGSIHLGMTRAEVHQILGQPDFHKDSTERDLITPDYHDSFRDIGLKVSYRKQSQIVCSLELVDETQPAYLNNINVMKADSSTAFQIGKQLDQTAYMIDEGVECDSIGLFLYMNEDPKLADEEGYDYDAEYPKVVLTVSIFQAGSTLSQGLSPLD
ncbi:MAG: hypothetical protein HC810_05650 [Acaryochloridaceae cyanobacterium RL_2_7]|nr:hypothetical protein [Acaryochloridaceae cyanobacterium RL_2_7]